MASATSGQTHGDIGLPMKEQKNSGVQQEVHPGLYPLSYRWKGQASQLCAAQGPSLLVHLAPRPANEPSLLLSGMPIPPGAIPPFGTVCGNLPLGFDRAPYLATVPSYLSLAAPVSPASVPTHSLQCGFWSTCHSPTTTSTQDQICFWKAKCSVAQC